MLIITRKNKKGYTMTVKNILIVGAVGVALIYFLSNQQKKAAPLQQSTQYGGYATDPLNIETESGVYYV